MTAVTLYAVFADMAEAQRIGRQMVEEQLAACVNILQPCRSIYRWEGAIETASEVPALFKTTLEVADRIIERITELHSYANPALVIWPITKLPFAFADWVEENVSG
ncbi:divalent-cation tolerance protein CutA [Sphingomonas alba]|uniref:Divalent-cation tolerance protein CutA n=1 Tax=Sphingomonas alba TaxID=2908208 RepID=A0ABT0RI96_9SPHN|nr:divalent-cation tolerance protein CutA [Sphingomonas alba]MCL6682312.1 divalent-cation tolerance protein CutA [Sphingomonas alba]